MSVIGNQNARRGRDWRDALRAELATYEDKERKIKRGQAFRRIARTVVEAALDGQEFAIREIGNRTDGKPVQVQEIDVEINARFVIETYRARLDDAGVRAMLEAAGAENLLPILDQLMIDKPKAIEHEPT